MADEIPPECDLLVIGGGIAGVSCAEEARRLAPGARVLLLSASRSLVGVRSVVKVTQAVEQLEVVERPLDFLEAADASGSGTGWLKARFGRVARLDHEGQVASMIDGRSVRFSAACAVCTGAVPRPLRWRSPSGTHGAASGATSSPGADMDPMVVRDSASVLALARRIAAAGAARAAAAASSSSASASPSAPVVAVLGNGPIACELATSLQRRAAVVWCLRDEYIGRTMLDATASRFLLEHAASPPDGSKTGPAAEPPSPAAPGGAAPSRAEPAGKTSQAGAFANAIGPNWADTLLAELDAATAAVGLAGGGSGSMRLVRGAEAVACRARLSDGAWGVWHPSSDATEEAVAAAAASATATAPCGAPTFPLQLLVVGGGVGDEGTEPTQARVIGVDVVVAATGVEPCVGMCPAALSRGPDGGLAVDRRMRVVGGLGRVYAAGDAASIAWGLGSADPTEGASPSDAGVDVGGEHWLPMRLWTQGRVSGAYAGARMASGALSDSTRGRAALTELELEGGYNLDLFAHCTSLSGRRVVLLGRFNGQGLEAEYEEAVRSMAVPTAGEASAGRLSRSAGPAAEAAAGRQLSLQVSWSPGEHYAKLVVLDDRVVGAVLVGETGLEEACERLIVGGHRLGGVDLTDPDVDIDAVLD